MKARNLLHGSVVGFLAGTVTIELVLLAALLYAHAPVGDATVAIGTLALAVATVALTLATFRVVRTTAEEMDLLRKQTDAITRQALTEREQLDLERDRLARDARTRVIWDELKDLPTSIQMLLGPDGGPGELILELRIVLKAKNVSPVAAQIDTVTHSKSIHAAIVNERIVAPAGSTEVVVSVRPKLFEQLELHDEELVLHYRSTISGEVAIERAALFIYGQVTNEPRDGIGGRRMRFSGYCYAISMPEVSGHGDHAAPT